MEENQSKMTWLKSKITKVGINILYLFPETKQCNTTPVLHETYDCKSYVKLKKQKYVHIYFNLIFVWGDKRGNTFARALGLSRSKMVGECGTMIEDQKNSTNLILL